MGEIVPTDDGYVGDPISNFTLQYRQSDCSFDSSISDMRSDAMAAFRHGSFGTTAFLAVTSMEEVAGPTPPCPLTPG